MKIKSISSFFVLFFCANILCGQNIAILGKVVDTQNQPIEFANILLKKSDDRKTYGSITDIDGNFKIDNTQTGAYEINVSFIGYQDWTKNMTITENLDLGNIILSNAINELGEVVVTSKAEVIARKEDKVIFNVAASPFKAGYDGMEVLQRAPNIIIDSNGGILIRNETVTVLFNGRISNLQGAELTNYIQNLRSEDIKNIEIQTHLSASTDAESSGGVINIILKKKPLGINGALRTQYSIKTLGDYTSNSTLNFNYGADNWNVYGSYNNFHRTNTTKNDQSISYFNSGNFLSEEGTWNSYRKRKNYQLGAVVDAMENHVFGIEFFATNFGNDFSHLSLVNFVKENNNLENGTALLEGLRSHSALHSTINYTWTIDTVGTILKIFADYSNQTEDGNNIALSTYNQGFFSNSTERNIRNATTKIYSSQADWEQYIYSKIKLETGLKYSFIERENDLQSDFLSNEEWFSNDRTSSFIYGEEVKAGYVSLNKKIQEGHFIKGGIRVENTDLERIDITQDTIIHQNYTDWFPSLYYSYDLSPGSILSFSYSKRLRRPPFFFLNNYVIKQNDFRYELGNPNLRPEYVNNYEISLKQKKQSFDIYYQKTTEAVNGIYFLIEEVSYYQKFNSGSQTQYGITYNRFGNINKWWYINLNTGIYLRKFTNEEGEDSFRRKTGYIRFSNNFKLNSTTKLDLYGYYKSKYEDAFYIEFPNYFVNLMFEKSFFEKKLTTRIYLRDIFNTTIYQNARPFDTFESTSVLKPQTQYITFWISYNFKTKRKTIIRKIKSKNDARGRL